ncbi:MAG TPA: type II toxin-antitoxin system VapC family toxin [bacterium]|nr:type II toxin-antitoxin system VapC family toxin [bacterium]
MMLFDTCALLWVTLDPDSLTEEERNIALSDFEAGEAAVSSISFWEVGAKIKKNRIDIGMPLEEYIHKIHLFGGFEIIPVDEMIWMENIRLNWDHRDPADRTIVATAGLRGIPILTKDMTIRAYYPNQGWL